jgi:hypothetical protein
MMKRLEAVQGGFFSPRCPATPATCVGRSGHSASAAAARRHGSARLRHVVRVLSLAAILLVGMLGPAAGPDVVQSAPGPMAAGGVAAAREAMVPNGQFISGWGEPRSEGRTHQGEDLAAPHGSPIYTPARLKISNTRWNDLGAGRSLGATRGSAAGISRTCRPAARCAWAVPSRRARCWATSATRAMRRIPCRICTIRCRGPRGRGATRWRCWRTIQMCPRQRHT